MELAPFSSPRIRRVDGCRGFVGPCPSTPLDAYGYVWSGRIPTCAVVSSFRPVRVESLAGDRISYTMPAINDDPLRRSHAEPSKAPAAALHAHTRRRARR